MAACILAKILNSYVCIFVFMEHLKSAINALENGLRRRDDLPKIRALALNVNRAILNMGRKYEHDEDILKKLKAISSGMTKIMFVCEKEYQYENDVTLNYKNTLFFVRQMYRCLEELEAFFETGVKETKS